MLLKTQYLQSAHSSCSYKHKYTQIHMQHLTQIHTNTTCKPCTLTNTSIKYYMLVHSVHFKIYNYEYFALISVSTRYLLHCTQTCLNESKNALTTEILKSHFIINTIRSNVYIVCIGVSTAPSKMPPPPLSCQALLKSANCPSFPPLGNPPLYLVFHEPS